MHYLDRYVPEHLFSEDHFKVLLHVDRICTELNGGFQVGLDPLMRMNKRTFNVLFKRAFSPKRPIGYPPYKNGPRNTVITILKDGTEVIDGDDIFCLHDMAEAGYIAQFVKGELKPVDAVNVGIHSVNYLSPRGKQVVDALKLKIAESGNYEDFTPPQAEA
jgi:hypothetical protein